MKIQPLHDLHLSPNTKKHHLKRYVTDADAVMLIGDNQEMRNKEAFEFMLFFFCEHFRNVIYVLGNHEYYGLNPGYVHEQMQGYADKFENLHWLHNDNPVTTIDDFKFVGMTLWFEENEENERHEEDMTDFKVIKQFKPWVYDQNREAQGLLMVNDDAKVIITHHVPSWQLMERKWRGNSLNRFFYNNILEKLEPTQPAYWFSGHKHESHIKQVSNFTCICNPKGYGDQNNQFNPRMVITL